MIASPPTPLATVLALLASASLFLLHHSAFRSDPPARLGPRGLRLPFNFGTLWADPAFEPARFYHRSTFRKETLYGVFFQAVAMLITLYSGWPLAHLPALTLCWGLSAAAVIVVMDQWFRRHGRLRGTDVPFRTASIFHLLPLVVSVAALSVGGWALPERLCKAAYWLGALMPAATVFWMWLAAGPRHDTNVELI